MADRKQLGALIRKARAAREWRQEDLARELRTTRSTVSEWESGAVWPGPIFSQKLRDVLGIDFPDEEHAGPVRAPSRLTPEAAKGVRYAALEMSKVLTRLFAQAVEADEAAEAAAAAALEANELAAAEAAREAAIATTRASAARLADRTASGTPARRQRRG